MTDPQTAESIKWLTRYCREHPLPKYGPAVHQCLERFIDDYLQWMKSAGYSRQTRQRHKAQLNKFLSFLKNRRFSREQIFTSKTIERFKKVTGQNWVTAINGLSQYLFELGKISKPLAKRAEPIDLPKIYEDYLRYQQTHRQATIRQITRIKRVLAAFNDYLQSYQIDLMQLFIWPISWDCAPGKYVRSLVSG